jgi:hypothetical protein
MPPQSRLHPWTVSIATPAGVWGAESEPSDSVRVSEAPSQVKLRRARPMARGREMSHTSTRAGHTCTEIPTLHFVSE